MDLYKKKKVGKFFFQKSGDAGDWVWLNKET